MPFFFYEGSVMTVCTLSHRVTAPRQLANSKRSPAFTFWLPLLERSKKPSSATKGVFLLWNDECNSFQLPFLRHKSQISALLLGAAVTFCLIRLLQSDIWQIRSTINIINWSSYDLATVLLMYRMLYRYSSSCKRMAQFSGTQYFLTQILTWGLRPPELNSEQEATLSNLPLNVSRNHNQLKGEFASNAFCWTSSISSN